MLVPATGYAKKGLGVRGTHLPCIWSQGLLDIEPSDAKCCKPTCSSISCPAGKEVPPAKDHGTMGPWDQRVSHGKSICKSIQFYTILYDIAFALFYTIQFYTIPGVATPMLRLKSQKPLEIGYKICV